MALKFLIQFPIFSPPPPDQSFHHHHHRPPATEIHFSRWNNNNNKFARQERTQKEIEDQLRFQKKFNSVDKIATVHRHISSPTPSFKSVGTPSAPSRSSIPGKKSKYSKPPNFRTAAHPHPAFRPTVRPRKIPTSGDNITDAGVKVSDSGVSYIIPEAPFEFQYSYTETPKVKPVKLREPAIAPFGPGTMPRPWTGRKPLNPSRKKLEFDSFKPPPPYKKGVKHVQAPGPYLPGSGPRYVQSREEVLGEPLSKEEIDQLVQSCTKSQRQLNMGRDGFTHNMLDNIHALWKRRRVCKIKCKGVCTVDMDNVRQQLEEKTGGKIIRSKGGIIYLFRGRNYNFKTRPMFPLMLWKPASPVYPRLVKQAPDGLTLDEANDMRKKGRDLIPICKLGKNGVYCNLVENVREAFEACELVRINCQGLNGSDYRKIGAKLKDLVPCVLISFEAEHILLWRGRDWKSSLPDLDDKPLEVNESENGEAAVIASLPSLSTENVIPDNGSKTEDLRKEEGEDISISVDNSHSLSKTESLNIPSCSDESLESLTENIVSTHQTEDLSEPASIIPLADGNLQDLSEDEKNSNEIMLSPQTEGVLLLLKQAVEVGSAVVLEDSCLDADTVFQKVVALAKTAPPGPTFRHNRVKKVVTEKIDKLEAGETEVKIVPTLSEKKKIERKSPRIQKKSDLKEDFLTVVPPGSLRVDELAKLLA